MTWLDKAMEEKLKNLPTRPFTPDLIFDFEDVQAAIAIVEAAIEATQERVRVASDASVADAFAKMGAARVAGKGISFPEEGIFVPMAPGLWQTEITFPTILRRSLFIAICSHIEHVLREWCRWLHAQWPRLNALGKKKKDESDLHNCMRYLRDDAGLAIGDFKEWPEWSVIDTFRLLRNCLAHDGGLVPPEHRAQFETLSYIEIDDEILMGEPVVHLLPDACENAATTAKTFFDRLAKACQLDPRSVPPR